MNSVRATDAQQDMDKAEGFVRPSVLSFRLKPDWESATPLFEKAATSFKVPPCVIKTPFGLLV